MTTVTSKADLRARCRRVRTDLNALIDWIELELEKADAEPVMSGPLSDRHHWILDRLRTGVALTRTMVQEQFGIGDKQAKRILQGLTDRQLIAFERKPRPGHYVLRTKTRLRRAADNAASQPKH